MMGYAIDANIGLRMWVRRFLHAACTAQGETLIIPQTAQDMMKQHYEALNTGRLPQIALKVWRGAPGNQLRRSTNNAVRTELEALEGHIMMGWNRAFGQWLEEEPLRNDSHWRVAPRTEQSMLTAIMLRRVRGWKGDAARDNRYGGTGEDSQVIAEAIELRAKWIASGNFGEGMREQLNSEIAKATLLAGRPTTEKFIITAEEAVEELAGAIPEEHGPGPDGYDLRTQLAYLVARSETRGLRDHQNDAKRLEQLTQGLARGGLEQTAAAITESRPGQERWTAKEMKRLEGETRELARRIEPSLRSDERRRAAERQATREVREHLGSVNAIWI